MYQVAHQRGVTNTTYLDQLNGLQIAVAAQPAAGKVNCLQFAAAVTTLEPAQGK